MASLNILLYPFCNETTEIEKRCLSLINTKEVHIDGTYPRYKDLRPVITRIKETKK